MRTSQRASRIAPFYVMEMAKSARQLADQFQHSNSPMLFLNIGEPDFTAPPLVQEAAIRVVQDGRTAYTHALGLDALRERISDWYRTRFGLAVPARRIVVTAGASAALQLACLALIEAGDEVLMPDPCYPCNRQFVQAADGRAVLLPTTAEQRFQLSAAQVQAHWQAATRGVLLASPSNPTGTSVALQELRQIHRFVSDKGGITLVDEIYLGLSHDPAFGQSALAIDDQIISINSFSKYFNMTGWRLGWLVVPEPLVAVIERLAQNLFICPSTVAQYAALACFEPESLALYEERRAAFKHRRDQFIPQLNAMGLTVPVMPDGAFYAWADCRQACQRLGLADSWAFAEHVMHEAHVVITPGRDFSHHQPGDFVRLSTASAMETLNHAAQRLRHLLETA
ncbi:MAG: pyridoxal phosphate-dependent aminotransferase [Betaproteobacteria bacterium]|nr:pyridoxal phosphate-dependent aminotransferase [Betaproteobacteria bacterium]